MCVLCVCPIKYIPTTHDVVLFRFHPFDCLHICLCCTHAWHPCPYQHSTIHTCAIMLHVCATSLHQCQPNNCLAIFRDQVRPRWSKYVMDQENVQDREGVVYLESEGFLCVLCVVENRRGVCLEQWGVQSRLYISVCQPKQSLSFFWLPVTHINGWQDSGDWHYFYIYSIQSREKEWEREKKEMSVHMGEESAI